MDQPQTPDRSNQLNPAFPAPNGSPTNGTPEPNASAAEVPAEAPPPPQTPVAWLKANAFYLVMGFLIVLWIYNSSGLNGLYRAALVVFGLGFVIFIHELGHFVAAKWCDVHVQTFSIGFGPALPGCSCRYGETLYKLALIPLGGYVAMVGEGFEADENEDYPRSFKNKTVGQRMVIISAGVVMNVILAAVCFVAVYRIHGVEDTHATVASLDTGSPAWVSAVRSGSTITQIDQISNPWWEDLKSTVVLRGADHGIEFVFKSPPGEGKPLDVTLVPRRDWNDPFPVIGVRPGARLKLPSKEDAEEAQLKSPASLNSAAYFAREMNLEPGDVVVKATDPEKNNELTELPSDSAKAWKELCKRLTDLGKAELVVEVRSAAGGVTTKKFPAVGFEFGDNLVGSTDPATPDKPFNVKPLPLDLERDPKEHACSAYDFRNRMKLLAGKPAVVQVIRDKDESAKPVNILVPPAYHYVLGMDMNMGRVAAVRDGSPARKAGLVPSTDGKDGDLLRKITMFYHDGTEAKPAIPMDDPVKIPFVLAQRAAARPVRGQPVKVRIEVVRFDPQKGTDVIAPPLEMQWDDSWDLQEDVPFSAASPMSIPQLGLAYWVTSTVAKLDEKIEGKPSPAAEAGIKTGDTIRRVEFRDPTEKSKAQKLFSFVFSWMPEGSDDKDQIKSKRGPNKVENFDQWAHYFFALQGMEKHKMWVKTQAGDKAPWIELAGVQDETWPLVDRGLILTPDTYVQKADGIAQAMQMGLTRTWRMLKQMYQGLARLLEGRVSTKTLGGPIELAASSFSAARNIWFLVLWLGFISLNLAVVNFLPIPVLDGGHMVFLLYEKVRGRPPSETVRAVATYVGLAMIVALMLFVTVQDFIRRVLNG